MKSDKEIFEMGQKDRFGNNPYLWSSSHWETWEFGRRLPDKEFKRRAGSKIYLKDGRAYKFTYTKKGNVLMDEIR